MKSIPHTGGLLPQVIRIAASVALAAFIGAPPARADITYTLNFDPASSPEAQQVANSVTVAAAFYNQHGSFNKHWWVYHNPGIPTAEANYDGYMGYGGLRHERVVFHEAAHTFGMGTYWAYWNNISGGLWQGYYGNRAQWEGYHALPDGIAADGHAIWPGGFNYDNEDGFVNRLHHVRVMAGIRADMGLLSFTREPRNQAVAAGGTAEIFVESPMASAWQWQKNGVNLTNGGDISGADTATLRIANAEAADAGSYRCVVTGAGETLNSRPRQLWVHPSSQLGQWTFNGNANDSLGTQHGAAFGSPAYVTGKIGQAVDLDGTDEYIDLPDPVGRTGETTIATWVNWDGGGDWQRIFDFGTGTLQYFCLTPRAAGGGLRLSLKDPFLGTDSESQVNSTALPTGQWVHLAAVLRKNYMTLYVNGQAVGSTFGIPSSPVDFPATNNYIGKSQFSADPNFNGRVDDFRVHARALSGAEIWSLWGQSTNQAPVFSASVNTLPPADASTPYTGVSLTSYASDPESNPLTFTKLDGPSWLNVAANGTLSGQPTFGTGGLNSFVVRVSDSAGASSDATLEIQVTAPPPPPLARVTASATAPIVDADDASFLPGSVAASGAIDGTNNPPDNDESTYVSEDRTSKGQTFTTGSDPAGYALHAFTFQIVNLPSGTSHDVYPGDRWEIEIGTMNGTTKTPILKHAATYDSAYLSDSNNSGAGRYLTFNLAGWDIDLAPNTTHYVEIAQLYGGSYFELNSSKTGTYSGGTAFRGNTAGTIGTGVNLLTGDFAFHANLKAGSASFPTVAYWNFEEGTPDTYVPYSRSSSFLYDGSILDRSGNGYPLSTWSSNLHWYRPLVPAANTPQTGVPNTLSLQNAVTWPSVSSTGTYLNIWSPTAWTIEAAIRPDDATNGWQTFLGRDSQGTFAGDPARSALHFGMTPDGALLVGFIDAAGNYWSLASANSTVQDGQWQAVAATSDGDTLSLYLKNLTDGDPSYTLVGTLDISASTNPALSTGGGDGGDWNPGDFSLARGLYNGGHTDRYLGYLDDVRLSDGALSVNQLLYQAGAVLPPAPAGVAATTVSTSRIDLSWNAASGATSYNVKRSTTSGGPYTTVGSAVTGTSFSDSDLASGTTYYYAVTALNANGESASSAQAIATTLSPPPAPWTGTDIGSPGIAGWSGYNAGTFTVSGSGVDIWDGADAYHAVAQTLAGDGEIRARVTSQTNTDPWAKAGVMIRDGSGAGAVNAYVAVTPGNGNTFQWRSTASGASSFTPGPALNPAPNNWVRLTRSGSLFTAYVSANGTTWTQVGTTTLTMGSSVSASLAVTSHNNSALGTATFDNVTVTPFPSPWQTANIGTTGLQGGAEYFSSAFTVKGAGAFGGTSDGFRYVYRTLNGDGTIVARVQTLHDTGTSARVGLMLRDTLAANSRMAALTVNGSGAWRWQRRTTTGGSVSTTNSSSGTAPNLWVRLVRTGNSITASRSTNGTSWTTIGSASVSMATTCHVGLAVASGTTTTLNTSVIDNVIMTSSSALLAPDEDADGDGLVDTWEALYYNPAQYGGSDDPDGDGYSNRDEFTGGTSPSDGSDFVRLKIVSASPAVFEFEAKAGRSYVLERLSPTDNAVWIGVHSTGPVLTDGTLQVTDPTPPAERGIYRLQFEVIASP